tara:strand:- start:3442 stop:3993 length:552 start_codon:yes stop_codon:yes gene_type:complete
MASTRLINVTSFRVPRTAVATIDFTDVFSADYSAYEIFGTSIGSVSGDNLMKMALIKADGNVSTSSVYDWKYNDIRDSGTTQSAGNGADDTTWTFSRHSGYSSYARTTNFRMVIAQPFETNTHTMFYCETESWVTQTARYMLSAGIYFATDSITGFRLSNTTAGTNANGLGGGTVKVYGIGGS